MSDNVRIIVPEVKITESLDVSRVYMGPDVEAALLGIPPRWDTSMVPILIPGATHIEADFTVGAPIFTEIMAGKFDVICDAGTLLGCIVTQAKENAKGRKASKLLDEADAISEELKSMTKVHRESLKQKRAEARGLMKDVGTGTEDRDVVCFEDRDYKAGSIGIVRTDTGMVVETRTMTGEERQETLFRGKTGPAAEGKLISLPPGAAPPAKKRGRKSNAQKAAEAAAAASATDAAGEPLEN